MIFSRNKINRMGECELPQWTPTFVSKRSSAKMLSQNGMMLGHSKEAYNTLEALTKMQQRKSAVIKHSGGNILMKSTAVLNRWTPTYLRVTRTHIRG